MSKKEAKTTMAIDGGEIAKEKLRAVVSILESNRFNRAMRKIDTLKEAGDEAKKDVIGYLKKERIELPEGVDIEVKEVKTKLAKKRVTIIFKVEVKVERV